MSETAKTFVFILIAALALGLGFYFGRDWREQPPESGAAAALRQASFTDLNGQPASLAAWEGKLRIVNFWATWCAPCREEIPLLSRFQTEHAGENLQIVGIAIDSPDQIRKFQQKLPFAFPTLVADAQAIPLMKSLGNSVGGLPFSVFLDPQGGIVGTHLGPLSEPQLNEALARLKQR